MFDSLLVLGSVNKVTICRGWELGVESWDLRVGKIVTPLVPLSTRLNEVEYVF
jgi:hypothetical protein